MLDKNAIQVLDKWVLDEYVRKNKLVLDTKCKFAGTHHVWVDSEGRSRALWSVVGKYGWISD